MSSQSYYEEAIICRQGHVISAYGSTPKKATKFCDRCGASTVGSCSECDTSIRGEYFVPGVFAVSECKPPSYCHECGNPYPWTSARLEAARELIAELKGLSEEEKQLLEISLEDIAVDGPRTELAATRIKLLLAKAGQGAGSALYKVIIDYASETTVKLLKQP